MRLVLAAALAGLVALDDGAAPDAAGSVFLETSAPKTTFVAGEPIRVAARFGIERRFLAENLIQVFGRRVDVPVAIEWEGFGAMPGEVRREPAAPPDGRASCVLNGELAIAAIEPDREIGGRAFAVFSIERVLLPEAPGELPISAPALRASYATRFDDDLIQGRVPLEKREALVRAEPLALRVEARPEAGKPRDYGGAVGTSFTVSATAAPREVTAGESLKLELRIDGDGNFETFESPRLDGALAGSFHVLGAIESRSAARRTVTYDVAPLDARVTAVPPIAFSWFDAAGRAYRTALTEAIPIVVRPKSGGGAAPAAIGPELRDRRAIAEAPADEAPLSPALFAAALAAPALAAIALLAALRARERERSDPARARARAAQAAFRARLDAAGDAGAAEALAEYLAARLGCAPSAVIAPGLAARLEAAGAAAPLAARAAALLDSLVAARYGGGVPKGSGDAAREIVGELEGRPR